MFLRGSLKYKSSRAKPFFWLKKNTYYFEVNDAVRELSITVTSFVTYPKIIPLLDKWVSGFFFFFLIE